MDKILDWKNLKDNVDELRRQGKKIAFTNGCFDILHVGHTRYLRQAREKGDVLILALNSDASVRRIKGEKRPLIPQDERAELLSCLEFVDYVTLFDESTPLNLILYLKPDVLIKGGDWPEDQVVGRREVLSWGGTVSIIPEIPGASTTNIVDKILAVYRDKL
ncbi:MAG: Bifunctional protein HldE [Syntrophus sp. PtaU1.Bin005]|uniref:D-glycero-beta-D-manno-heptose 1-phosphate adenylyltransferase n=1 Tax=Syntrophus buswellii TaxID=43774 RepID=UPI0009D467CD|nr:MAG: Bifunctional protein HldE [Syntrophus sp. PtaB.Bin138]OPY83250.1 MAG: Bifunctional protein HldE [Syntrophus sp. PtaU1.Bin005]